MPPTMVQTAEGMQDVVISEQNGHGHESMGDFVRHHMQCILQPFADHVDELHKAVDLLQNDLIETTNMAQSNRSRLDRHDELLSGLRKDTDLVTDQARTNAKLIGEATAEHNLLEADHDRTKRRLEVVSDELQATAKSLTDEQHGLSATNATVEVLQQRTRATDEKIARHLEPGISALRVDLQKLDDRAVSTQSLLDATKAYGEGMRSDLDKQLKVYESQTLKDEQMFAHIHESTNDLLATINQVDHRLQTQAEHLKTTNSMLRPLKVRVEQHGSCIKAQDQQHADLAREVTDSVVRISEAEKKLQKLVDKFGADDDAKKKGPTIFETVQKLTETLNRANAIISNLEDRTEVNEETLKKDSVRMDDIDIEIFTAKERIDLVEDKIGFNDPPEPPPPPPPKASKWGVAKNKVGPEDPGRQSIVNVVKMLSITQGQKKNKAKLDKTAEELEHTKTNLTLTKQELKEAENRVNVLEVGLTNTNELVSKLGLGLDLTQEYWSGLSKGFRDTHKSVAIDNDMLPAKGSHAVTLPSIPSGAMVSPASTLMPSGKRPVSQGGRPAPHSAR